MVSVTDEESVCNVVRSNVGTSSTLDVTHVWKKCPAWVANIQKHLKKEYYVQNVYCAKLITYHSVPYTVYKLQ